MRQRRIILALGLCAALLWGPAVVGAQEEEEAPPRARGTIFFESVPAQADNFAGASYLWRFPAAPQAAARLPLDQLLVVLVGSSEGAAAQTTVTLRGLKAWPRALALAPNSEVTFVNEDPLSYTLQVPGREMAPLPLEGAGGRASVTLDKPGRYAFQAPGYASVTTYVVVGPVRAYSALEGAGPQEAAFDLGALPEGTYQFELYFRGERLESMRREVRVTATGALEPARFLIKREDFSSPGRP